MSESQRQPNDADGEARIDLSTADGVPIVRPIGHLDERLEDELIAECLAALEATGRLILDLSRTRYVNSAGLGALVRVVASANSDGRQVILAAPTAFVGQLFKTTMLDRFFTVADSPPAAAKLLSTPASRGDET